MSREYELFSKLKPFVADMIQASLPGPGTSVVGSGVTMAAVQAAVQAAIGAHAANANAHHVAWTLTDTDARYYTKTQLDGGQLDGRYFTEAEADGRFALRIRTITAGVGLSGGGDLTANRTIALASSSAPAGASILASSAGGAVDAAALYCIHKR